jgi:hypothetical protein
VGKEGPDPGEEDQAGSSVAQPGGARGAVGDEEGCGKDLTGLADRGTNENPQA